MTRKETTNTIDSMLDAAAAVILDEGIAFLTLEKVAQRAGVSKGGLLYHFPSKDALVDAIVARVAREWKEDLDLAISAMPPGPTRVPRAILRNCVSDLEAWDERLRTTSIALMAAMASDRRHAGPIRVVSEHLSSLMLADGMPAPEAELFLTAMDGLWISWVFGLRDQQPRRREYVHEALNTLLTRLEAAAGEPRCAADHQVAAQVTEGLIPPTTGSAS